MQNEIEWNTGKTVHDLPPVGEVVQFKLHSHEIIWGRVSCCGIFDIQPLTYIPDFNYATDVYGWAPLNPVKLPSENKPTAEPEPPLS